MVLLLPPAPYIHDYSAGVCWRVDRVGGTIAHSLTCLLCLPPCPCLHCVVYILLPGRHDQP